MSSDVSHPQTDHRQPSVHTETSEDRGLQTVPDNGTQSNPDASKPSDGMNGFQQEPGVGEEESSDSEFLWSRMRQQSIGLARSDPDSDSETLSPSTEKVPQAVEVNDFDGKGSSASVKPEPTNPILVWSNTSYDPIVLSDADDDDKNDDVILTGGTTPPIKEELNEDRVRWSEVDKSGLIELLDSDDESNIRRQSTPFLGNSLLRRSGNRDGRAMYDPERIRQMQQLYTAQALDGKPAPSRGAGAIFSVPRPSHQGRQSISSRDGNAWMRCAPKELNDATSNFAEIKHQYKEKKKAKMNTLQDEIAFKKAQDAERVRIKKLEARMIQIDSSEDEAEQDDDDLFIPDGTPPPSSSKRCNADDTTRSGNSTASKKHKSDQKPMRTKSELRNELYHNLMAGYEEELAKDQKKQEHQAMQADKAAQQEVRRKAARKNPNAKHTSELLKGKKPGGKSIPKPKSKSKMKPITVRNLKTANIYKESNANLEKLSMPSMSGKEKRKAMANLIASIPLEESKIAQATSDKASILKATTILGNCRVNENRAEGQGDWSLKGLTTPLYHYQVQGVARMKERELGEKPPQGGMLADEMGTGKTIQGIALMIANRPAPAEQQRCTLIICNSGLLSQWDDEIKKHTNPNVFGNILRHYGQVRVSTKGASGRDAINLMESAGVVLSTYSEVLKSYPKCDIPEHLTTPVDKMTWWKNEWEHERGLLHRVQFYRVYLDESQVIKNHRSYTSIACRALMAKHRWTISGTPIQNSIDEIYPYFKFLRIPYTGSFRIFKHNYCDPDNEACAKRLHSYLDYMMIRRTHQDEVLGTAILKLPKAHHETKYLQFNKIEAKIYDNIRKRFVKAINVALHDGRRTEDDRCRMVLTMVLRLRQITSHLFMLHETMEAMFDAEQIEDWSDLIDNTPEDSECSIMSKALQMLLQAKDDEYSKEKSKEKATQSKDEPESIRKFRKELRNLKDNDEWVEFRDRTTCHRCKLPAEEPMITSCLHLYCAECLKVLSYEASENNQDHSNCLKCNEAFTGSTPAVDVKELEAVNILSTPLEKPRATKTQGGLTDGVAERPRRSVNDTMKWLVVDDKMILSTKTAAVVNQLEQWLRDFPKQKIIVFSQFHLVFQILGKVCERKNWKPCHYNGKMSHKAREDAVEKFRDDPETRVLIASLKCGGIGLNLTMASRVICVDLWFNSCVEQQAFCRVLRIGQKFETHITRFVVKGTIDEHLIRLQNYKDRIISAAMDDRTVLAQLSLKELLHLFGEVGYDANNQPFIYAEDNSEKLFGPLKEQGKETGKEKEKEKEKEIVVDNDDDEPQEDEAMEGA